MANRRSSFDSFGLRGQWWLPENPEEVLSGTLSYMPEDGIRLHLTGKFSGEKELTFDHRAQAILGTTNEGPATIVDAILESGQGPGFPPGRTAVERTYFCTRLLLGERFPKPEALIFDRALVTFANFEELLDYRPVEHKAGAEKDAYEDIYVVRRREDKFYHIPELDSTVTLYGELPGFSFPSYREVILRSRVVMEFKPGRPQPLKFFDKAIFQTANFLSLLIGVPVYRLTYTIPEVQEDDKVVRETVQVVTDIGRSKPPEPLHWHRF